MEERTYQQSGWKEYYFHVHETSYTPLQYLQLRLLMVQYSSSCAKLHTAKYRTSRTQCIKHTSE